MFPPNERMSAFFLFLFLHKDQSVNSLLFLLTNPENQYATNSLILTSYLTGEEAQNKNTQGWHGSLLWLPCCCHGKASVSLAPPGTSTPGRGSFWGLSRPAPQRLPALHSTLALLVVDWEGACTPIWKGSCILPWDTRMTAPLVGVVRGSGCGTEAQAGDWGYEERSWTVDNKGQAGQSQV